MRTIPFGLIEVTLFERVGDGRKQKIPRIKDKNNLIIFGLLYLI